MLLRNATQLEGHALHANDGRIGKVTDFYFDDRRWHIRYCVVSTGPLLARRTVLISPVVMGAYNARERTFYVDLTVEQVRNSPNVATNTPPSRRHEEMLARYYGWPGHWDGAIGPYGVVAPVPFADDSPDNPDAPPTDGMRPVRTDPYLRSANDTLGYDVWATDGRIGHVDDLLIDDMEWRIRYLAVATRIWWPGKKVVVEPDSIHTVSWSEGRVLVDLSRESIRSGRTYEPLMEWSPQDAMSLR